MASLFSPNNDKKGLINITAYNKTNSHKSVIDHNALKNVDEPSFFSKLESYFFNIKEKLNDFLLHSFTEIYSIFMSSLTLYIIFAEYARILVTPDYDEGFYAFNAVCLGIFVLEILISLCRNRTRCFQTFFFYFDVLAALSIILDIGWIRESVLNEQYYFFIFYDAFRLIRIVKLYKYFYEIYSSIEVMTLTQKQLKLDYENLHKQSHLGLNRVKSSNSMGKNSSGNKTHIGHDPKIRHQLTHQINKKVIILIMTIMISVPVFLGMSYKNKDSSFTIGLNYLGYLGYEKKNNAAFNYTLNNFFEYHKNDDYNIIYLQAENLPISTYNNEKRSLRKVEKLQMEYISKDGNNKISLILDIKQDYITLCVIGIIKTIIIFSIFIASTFLFDNDTMKYVVTPIENMYFKINSISKNPLEAAHDYKAEYEKMYINEKKKVKEKKFTIGKYETTLLNKTINKIGSLLAMSFGESGAEVIQKNMSAAGDIDPMIRGQKIYAIFSFCIIKNFPLVTQILKEDIMIFINLVCEIIHQTIDSFHGIVNKNREGSFLFIWKYPRETLYFEGPDEIKINDLNTMNQISDLSILSILKLFIELKKSKKLHDYIIYNNLQEAFPNEYVEMAAGMHAGWASEGSIGSDFKIDPSFLSPSVNIAAKLEHYTSFYNTDIILSEKLYTLLNQNSKRKLRKIDRVLFQGYHEQLNLYTCDIDLSEISVDNLYIEKTKKEKNLDKFLAKIRRKERFDKILSNQIRMNDLFFRDSDYIKILKKYPRDFYVLFEQAMNYYINGEWDEAKNKFERSLKISKSSLDGPTLIILQYLAKYEFLAPVNWDGSRDLN